MFISFEGNEGTGKSTQLHAVKEALENKGFKIVTVREPGATPVGEAIRKIFKSPPEKTELTGWCEAFLISAARHQLVNDVIEPELKKNSIVVADRYIDSTLVYQGIAKNLPFEEIKNICQIATHGRMPDMTFLFHAPIEIIKERIQSRLNLEKKPEADRFDNADLETIENLSQAFDKVAKMFPGRITKIDSTQPADSITKLVVEKILAYQNKAES